MLKTWEHTPTILHDMHYIRVEGGLRHTNITTSTNSAIRLSIARLNASYIKSYRANKTDYGSSTLP